MKINKWQIILILALVWLYTHQGVTPFKPFSPDLSDADLSAKVLAGMLVVADDLPKKVTVVKQEAPVVVESDKIVVEGRRPRVINLTDLKFCSPCIQFHNTTIQKLKSESHRNAGWTVGPSNKNVVEVVDLNRDKDLFYSYIDLVQKFNPDLDLVTPMHIKIDKSGAIADVAFGNMPTDEFIKFATKVD